jgi:DNA-binding SARP family transcriptional activator
MDESTESRNLEIHLLGDFRLTYAGDPVDAIDTPRLQSLLAYLLLHRGAPQSRRRIAFLFWPDSTEGQALTNLRNLLFRLRRGLPEADRFLEVDRKTLRWVEDAPFELDVAAFERALEDAETAAASEADGSGERESLERAVELYTGDLLPSCYDDWIDTDRQRLRQAYRGALMRLVDVLEDRQDYQGAIGVAERLVRHDPVREVSYRRLMELRAAIGDRAGALRTYHRCTSVLEEELGVEPSAATRDVYERLLAAEETPRISAMPRRRAKGSNLLVGREEAWATLQGAWRRAARGTPHVALISGEAGIGKTRLAEEVSRWAGRKGIQTATSRCYGGEGDLAYGLVTAWLRALPRPELAPVWRSEVARIFPEIVSEESEVEPSGPLSEPWERNRFYEALARAVLSQHQPLVLVADALQWCDRGTYDWLLYLLRHEAARQLLIIGTYRIESVDRDHPLTSLVHQLRHDDQVTEIELSPLTKRETAMLAQSMADRELSTRLVECLYGETEGNPLFIVETVRAGLPDEVRDAPAGGFVCVPRPLPSRIQDALMARVDQLSTMARGLAELAATIGREFTFDVLMEASGTREETLIRGLDELWQHRIIREHGAEAYDFTHDKLREVIYGALSVARRRMLHRHVARALESVYADDLDGVAARLALHCERADEPEMAVAYYERAAAVADRMQAVDDAARYRERAGALRGEERRAN